MSYEVWFGENGKWFGYHSLNIKWMPNGIKKDTKKCSRV